MERNMDKFDHQIKWSSDDPTGLLSGQQAAKSYTCNFCKRGFSNAQALGGHMNIHRRDRARIRQYSEDQQNQQQLSNSDNIHAALKINPISHHDDHELIGPDSEDKTTSFHHLEVNEPNIPRSKVAYPFSREDGDINVVDALGSNKGKVGAIQEIHDQVQLPLFLEEPSPANMIITENIINIMADHEKMKMTEELDLELRLGPEPPGTTSPTLSTRDFF